MPPAGKTAAKLEPGLLLVGEVIGRARKKFDVKGGGVRYNIVLTIMAGGAVYKPERWSDLPSPTDIPSMGEQVELPVALVTYNSKQGTNYRLNWGAPAATEEF